MGTLQVTSWEKGITDEYLDAEPGFSRKLHNLFLKRNGKPQQRPGLSVFGIIPQIPLGAQQIDSVYYFDRTIFVKSGNRLYYYDESAGAVWTHLIGVTFAFPDSELGAKASWSEWRGHLIITPGPGPTTKGGCRTQKVYRDAGNVWKLLQAGLPIGVWGDPGFPVVTVGSPAYSFVLYQVFYYTYVAKVNGVVTTFEDYGPPAINAGVSNPISAGNPITGTSLNYTTVTDNYDFTNFKVRFFRTKQNGTIPYYTGVEVNRNTAFSITGNDDSLTARLYLGVEEGNYNDHPPCSYFQTVTDGIAWFLAGKDNTQFGKNDPRFTTLTDSGPLYTNRIWSSKPGNFDSVPSGNFGSIEGDIATAFDHAGVHPVAFFRNRCFRIEGRIDELGGGIIRAVRISSTEGAVSQDTCRTNDGIYFMSENGFCFTNGFQVVNLSKKHLRQTYKDLVSKANAAMAYDAENRMVFFGVQSPDLSEVTTSNNAAVILDENFSEVERGSFLTMASDDDFRPTAMHYDSKNNRILFGDAKGFIWVFDTNARYDYDVDTTTPAIARVRKAIVWNWISTAWSFGDQIATKWVTHLYATFKNLTGHLSVDFFSINDDKTIDRRQFGPVRERKEDNVGVHRVDRHFPRRGIRCTYKQLEAKKGLVNLYSSHDFLVGTVAGLTVTLSPLYSYLDEDGGGVVGDTIYFDFDDYETGFLITSQATNVLTVTDPGGDIQAGIFQWLIKGYPKDEGLEMHSVSVDFDILKDAEASVKMGGDGGNG